MGCFAMTKFIIKMTFFGSFISEKNSKSVYQQKIECLSHWHFLKLFGMENSFPFKISSNFMRNCQKNFTPWISLLSKTTWNLAIWQWKLFWGYHIDNLNNFELFIIKMPISIASYPMRRHFEARWARWDED